MPKRSFETVFVTAYDNYAMDALNNNAAYYFIKPFNIDEFVKAVEYVSEIGRKEDALADKVLRPKLRSVEGKITLPQ